MVNEEDIFLVQSSPVPRTHQRSDLNSGLRLLKKNVLTDFDELIDGEDKPTQVKESNKEDKAKVKKLVQKPWSTHSSRSTRPDSESIEKCQLISKLIRKELTDLNQHEDQHFFSNLSGWETDETDQDLIKVLNLDDGPSYSYIECHEQKPSLLNSIKMKNRRKFKPQETPSKPCFRAIKDGWGEEEDTHKPYALQVPYKGPLYLDECSNNDPSLQEDIKINDEPATIRGSTPYQTAKLRTSKKPSTPKQDSSASIVDIDKILESTPKNLSKPQSRASRVKTPSVSSTSQRDRILTSNITAALYKKSMNERPVTPIAIEGIKYVKHTGDCRIKESSSRPVSCNDRSSPNLPRIQSASTDTKRPASPALTLLQAKNSLAIHSSLSSKSEFYEIPKWYEDSGKRDNYDRNLRRFMELMGNDKTVFKFRSPRKLSVAGFQTIPMIPVPPEHQGLVIKHVKSTEPRSSWQSVATSQTVETIASSESLCVARSFRDEIHTKRIKQNSSLRKISPN